MCYSEKTHEYLKMWIPKLATGLPMKDINYILETIYRNGYDLSDSYVYRIIWELIKEEKLSFDPVLTDDTIIWQRVKIS